MSQSDSLDPHLLQRLELCRGRRARHADLLAHSAARQAALPAAAPRRGPVQRAARLARQFRNAPLAAKRAHVKTLVRDLLLLAGAEEAAASGVPAHRRAALLAQHLLGRPSRRARPGAGQPGPAVRWQQADAVPWEGPLVSVVVAAGPNTGAARAALAPQTLERFEVVTWDAATRTVSFGDAPPATFVLPADVALGSTLLGRYAWVAPDVALPAAYLALNVFALESEQLELAVNAFGFLEDGVVAVAAGRVPGTNPPERPLVVGRAELLRDDLTWSLDGLPGQHGNRVCGRLIAHPSTPVLAPPDTWTGTLSSTTHRFAVAGASLVAGDAAPPRRVTHAVRPIDLRSPMAPGPAAREHVLVFLPFVAVGGAEIQTLEVLRRLRDRFTFVVATTEPLTPALGTMVADYFEVAPAIYTLPETVHRHVFLSATREILSRHAIGTVFVANGSTWVYDAAPELKARAPFLHLVNQVFDHEVGWINRYDADLVRTFDRHVAPNPRIVEAYVRKGVDPSRIDLIYPAIVTGAYARTPDVAARAARLRTELGLEPNVPLVVMAGRLHTQKRPLDFLALAQRFAPTEAMFLLVGDGPLAGEVDRQVARLSLPHLRRRPFHRPVTDVLAAADVVTILSDYEGLPLVLLEAQTLGTPVVGTDVGAIREALEWTGGGVTVPIGDLPSAERAVRTLLADPPDMVRASARVRERFDIDVSARGHAAAFLA